MMKLFAVAAFVSLLALVLTASGSLAADSSAQGPKDPSQGVPRDPRVASGMIPEQAELFHLGQKLWPLVCNDCHNARNPAEVAAYQWDMIIMHMRTLRNLTPHDASALLEFLKTAR